MLGGLVCKFQAMSQRRRLRAIADIEYGIRAKSLFALNKILLAMM
jgi:hypothetical protein